MTNTPYVVFCTATQSIIDYVHTGRGETHDAAIRRLQPNYGAALSVMPANEAQHRYEARFKTGVSEITEEDFLYALNVLPPVGWRTAHGGEVFRISERTAGVVTAIFVAMQGRFFTFHDDIRLEHDACCERVAAFIASNPSSPVEKEPAR